MNDRYNKRRAYAVVRELGGVVGGLTSPLPFSGSEIRIEFHDTQFKGGDLGRLSVLRPLSSGNWVGVMFKDTNVSRRDIIELQAELSNCSIFRVVDGERKNDR